MLDADNYFLQPSSVNRPEGPRLQQTYLEPRAPEPVRIREN